MSKSIFVCDTPVGCNKCPLFTINSETLNTFCLGFKERRKIDMYVPVGISKPSWCPLVELPENTKQADMMHVLMKF